MIMMKLQRRISSTCIKVDHLDGKLCHTVRALSGVHEMLYCRVLRLQLLTITGHVA